MSSNQTLISIIILTYKGETTLEEALDEIIPWVKDQVEIGEM